MTLIDGIILAIIVGFVAIITRSLWKKRGQCSSGCASCSHSTLCQLDLYQEFQKEKANHLPNA